MIEKLYKIAKGQTYMNHTLLETTPENVRKIHGMMLEILDPVHQLFAKNNIRYIAAYGTLLGIVREDGFIKNDDDIDLEIYKDDWERAINLLKHNYKLDMVDGGWYKLDYKDIVVDFVRSDNSTLSWSDTDEMFTQPLQTYRLYDKVECNIPERTLALKHLEEVYGTNWNVPVPNYNEMRFVNFWGFFIILLTILFYNMNSTISITIILIVVLYMYVANKANNSDVMNTMSCYEVVENLSKKVS